MICNVRVRTFDVDYVDLYWDVASGHDPLDYSFRVLRSEAQFGPFSAVTAPFTDRYHVRDSTARQFSRRRWYYKVEATHIGTSVVSVWPQGPGVSQEARLDLEGLEAARQFALVLEQYTGREVWVFPRRVFGTRCFCVDPVTRQVIRQVCVTCYGTGIVGGYHAPVRAYANIVVQAQGDNISEYMKDNRRLAQCLFGTYPQVKQGDLVVELENIRWDVAKTADVRKARAVVRQESVLHEHLPESAVYKLPLGESVPDLVVSPEQRFTLPATPEHALPRSEMP